MAGMSGRVAKGLERVDTYEDGSLIVREGEAGDEMFIVRSGQVAIRRGVEQIGTIERGDFFGEMSVLESLPRDADAVAIGRTEVLVLGPGALLLRLRSDPSLAVEMLQRLSGRIRAMNERLR
jgi:CRP-like cAMP-binding protein